MRILDPGSCQPWIRDGKKSDTGSGTRDGRKSDPGSGITSLSVTLVGQVGAGTGTGTVLTVHVLLELSSIHRCVPHLIHHIRVHSICIAQFVQNGWGVTIF
jgi:hypothetical protein